MMMTILYQKENVKKKNIYIYIYNKKAKQSKHLDKTKQNKPFKISKKIIQNNTIFFFFLLSF